MSLKRVWTTILILLMLLTMGQTFVFAQEATSTPEPTATSEATATPTPTPTPGEESLLDRLRRILGGNLPDVSRPVTPTPTPTATATATITGTTPSENAPAPGVTVWPTRPRVWPTHTPEPTRDVNAWNAQYFNNGELRGNPVQTRLDSRIAFDWGGGSPAVRVPVNGFSARWTRNMGVLDRGFNNITISTDFGVRVYIDGFLLVNHEGGPTNVSTSFWTDGDSATTVRVEYRHDSGRAYFSFLMNGAPIESAPFGHATVVNGTPALRDGPGQPYWSNGRVREGQHLVLTGHRTEAGNWVCVVTDDGTVGWLNTSYLQSTVVFGDLPVWPMVFPGPEPDSTVRQDVESARIRFGPGAHHVPFDSADAGERLVLVGRNIDSDWLLVRKYDGALGWVYSGHLNINYRISDLPVRWLDE